MIPDARICESGGYLVAGDVHVGEPYEFQSSELTGVIGCSQLECFACKKRVRNVAARELKKGVRPHAAYWDGEAGPSSRYVNKVEPVKRLYCCKCTSWLELDRTCTQPLDPHDVLERAFPWRCVGHPELVAGSDQLEPAQLLNEVLSRDLRSDEPRYGPIDQLKCIWLAASDSLRPSLQQAILEALATGTDVRLSRALATVTVAPEAFEAVLLSFDPNDTRLTAEDPTRDGWYVRDRLAATLAKYLARTRRYGEKAASLARALASAGARSKDFAGEVFWAETRGGLDIVRRVAVRTLASYASASEVRAFELESLHKTLGQFDSRLATMARLAGVLSAESAQGILWSLELTQSCLRTFLNRRIYDVGLTCVQRTPDSSDFVVPHSLPDNDVQMAHTSLEALEAGLSALLALATPEKMASAGEEWEASVAHHFLANARSCLGILKDVSKRVDPRRRPPLPPIGISPPPQLRSDVWMEFAEFVVKIAQLARWRDDLATQFCAKIRRAGYAMCLLQTIRSDNVIETIAGDGNADHEMAVKDLVGLSKHVLDKDESLRDIQADVAIRKCGQVVCGEDPRFDRFIFHNYGHDSLVRAFIPLVIFRDENGALIKNPPIDDCWVPKDFRQGEFVTCELALREPWNVKAVVIGTVEAGRETGTVFGTEIREKDALALAREVTLFAPKLYEYSLEHALEGALDLIFKVSGGSSAVLHLLQDDKFPVPYFLVRKGEGNARLMPPERNTPAGGIGAAPRDDGAGRRAVSEHRFIVVPDESRGETTEALLAHNPEIYEQGVRTLAVFPLIMGRTKRVVYVHYGETEKPRTDDLNAIWLLVQRCSEVLGKALEQADDRASMQRESAINRALLRLSEHTSKAAKALEDGDIGWPIAWITLNILAADVVTIHKCRDGRFIENMASVAGRLKHPEAHGGPALADDVRLSMLNVEDPVFEPNVLSRKTFKNQKRTSKSFVERESIVSAAAVPLRLESQTVGLMFINFRREHEFSAREIEVVRELAATSARVLSHDPRLASPAPNSPMGPEVTYGSANAAAMAEMAGFAAYTGVQARN